MNHFGPTQGHDGNVGWFDVLKVILFGENEVWMEFSCAARAKLSFMSTILCHPETRDRFEPICELRVCQGMTSDVPPFDSVRVFVCVRVCVSLQERRRDNAVWREKQHHFPGMCSKVSPGVDSLAHPEGQ